MSIFYGVIAVISLLLLVTFFIVDKKRDKWIMFLFVSILVCNTGYFLLSISNNLTMALISNSIAYIGNVFLPLCMLMLILKVCNINHGKVLKILLFSLSVIVAFVATSGGYLPIYYKEVSFEVVNGTAQLVKEYGPLHSLYYIYLGSYFLSMITIIIFAIIKNKLKSKMHAIFLSVIVFQNILVWLVEQLVPHRFEFLSVSYVISEFLLLMLYGMLQEYGFVVAPKNQLVTEEKETLKVDEDITFTQEQTDSIFVHYKKLEKLTQREKDVLKLIFKGEKRKDIASSLFITESAVKKHTTNIYKKLDVENRQELYKKAKKYL